MLRTKNKAQSTFEFVVLMIVVVAGFLTVQIYFKRGIQGKWQSTADDLGEQYDPYRGFALDVANSVTVSQTLIWTANAAGGQYTERIDNTRTLQQTLDSRFAGAQ